MKNAIEATSTSITSDQTTRRETNLTIAHTSCRLKPGPIEGTANPPLKRHYAVRYGGDPHPPSADTDACAITADRAAGPRRHRRRSLEKHPRWDVCLRDIPTAHRVQTDYAM